MNGKGDKWRGGWTPQYADNHNKIFGDKMSKNELTEEQIKKLQDLTDDILNEAKDLKKDYIKNPSEESGSVIQFHESSPYLVTKEERLITFNNKQIKIKSDVD